LYLVVRLFCLQHLSTFPFLRKGLQRYYFYFYKTNL